MSELTGHSHFPLPQWVSYIANTNRCVGRADNVNALTCTLLFSNSRPLYVCIQRDRCSVFRIFHFSLPTKCLSISATLSREHQARIQIPRTVWIPSIPIEYAIQKKYYTPLIHLKYMKNADNRNMIMHQSPAYQHSSMIN